MADAMPYRRSLRLPDFDYSDTGYYFVTICSKKRSCVFGNVCVGAGVLTRPQVKLSAFGAVVDALLSRMTSVEKYVVMPNHVHIIIQIQHNETNGPLRTAAPTHSLPDLIHYLKRTASIQCGRSLWQRGYYDHIIRNESDLQRIWQYIDENPAKWAEDTYYTT